MTSSNKLAATPIETLESRRLLASFVVDSLADNITADGQLTLREAITAASSNIPVGDAIAGDAGPDTITFADGLTGTITLNGNSLLIADDLIIDGAGRITIDANDESRIFETDSNLQLSNLVLTRGNADIGGAIFVNSQSPNPVPTVGLTNVTITDSVAVGDSASFGGGGAIAINNGNVTINSSALLNNAATGAAGSGGAITMIDGTLAVNASFINDNTANRAGGGIEIINGTALITDSSMRRNVAGPDGSAAPGSGGALHVTGMSTSVTVTNTVVDRNLAALEGGGLWNQSGSTLNVVNSRISNNIANGTTADDGGGGIFNNGGTLNVADSVIRANAAVQQAGSGGGIFSTDGTVTVDRTFIEGNGANRAGGGVEIITGTLTLNRVELNNNVAGARGSAAPGNGGGLHVTGPGAVVFIDRSDVSDNVARSEGGGVWNAAGSAMSVKLTSMVNNLAAGTDADNGGGAAFNNGGDLTVSRSTLRENFANQGSGSGGGILSTGGVLSVRGSLIAGNVASRAGGGIEVIDGNNGVFENSVIDGNLAGGVNAAPGNGGGVHVSGSGTFVLFDSSVYFNRASSEGGGLWNQVGTNMTIFNATITDNEAQGNDADNGGGGIFNNGGNLSVTSSLIQRNVATGTSGSGGGIFSTAGDLDLSNIFLYDNAARRAGGGIETIDGTLEINDASFRRNAAGNRRVASPGNGGGIHTSGVTTTNITNGFFAGNFAASEGGALWNQAGSTMTLNNTSVTTNSAAGAAADNGGGGIFNNGGDVNINDSSVRRNAANGSGGSGGGIFSTAGVINIDNTFVNTNGAARAGGGIETIDGTLNITNSQLDANTVGVDYTAAPGNGGGIHITGSTEANLTDTVVRSNAAANEGGGLWNQADSTMTLTRVTVRDNRTDGDGGGVFNNGGVVNTADSVVIRNNAAVLAGGGVYNIATGTVSLAGTNVGGNNGGNGGGIFNEGVLNLAAGVNVTTNRATNIGGGVFGAAGSTNNVSAANIVDNLPDQTAGDGTFA